MKKIVLALASVLAIATATAQSGNVVPQHRSVAYGVVEMDHPEPRVLNSHPVIVHRNRGNRHADPIFVYVPAHHRRNWTRFCGRYEACRQPVYFLNEVWYHRYLERQERREERRERWEERRQDNPPWDRDGDGVRNRDDFRPNNPYKQ